MFVLWLCTQAMLDLPSFVAALYLVFEYDVESNDVGIILALVGFTFSTVRLLHASGCHTPSAGRQPALPRPRTSVRLCTRMAGARHIAW